jgi:hypothetical protein
MGAKDTKLIVHQREGWRLLTSSVLHVSKPQWHAIFF